MICPQCRAEYRDGFTHCSDCGIELVDSLPEAAPRRRRSQATDELEAEALQPRDDPPEHFDLVVVLATADPGHLAVAKSLLRSAGIPFVSETDNIIDLFGIGRLSGCNPITGLPRLCVAPQDADDARALLAGSAGTEDTSANDDVVHS